MPHQSGAAMTLGENALYALFVAKLQVLEVEGWSWMCDMEPFFALSFFGKFFLKSSSLLQIIALGCLNECTFMDVIKFYCFATVFLLERWSSLISHAMPTVLKSRVVCYFAYVTFHSLGQEFCINNQATVKLFWNNKFMHFPVAPIEQYLCPVKPRPLGVVLCQEMFVK